jgi:hypothetical protein
MGDVKIPGNQQKKNPSYIFGNYVVILSLSNLVESQVQPTVSEEQLFSLH